eukprot:gnl/MRDRNA2_/MRDRNA2_120817_c0_seq1.p1 gnl/MRDRNA2_/MRDRNA2_120817_c0~~gnl/MRDRNA2_/MRDRNA2_120817_c0_seq1.p1  ORF type:complete len:113 (+),score=22.23 gnl/MRDRNA2_/MRDRNA2_120817_c0_seq1:86-424(+)
MSISVAVARPNGNAIISVNVSANDQVAILQKVVSYALDGEQCQLLFNGVPLPAHETFSDIGIVDGDTVTAVKKSENMLGDANAWGDIRILTNELAILQGLLRAFVTRQGFTF